MELVEERFPRLSHLWLDAGYNGKGKGKEWAEKVLGLTVEVVRPPSRWVWVREDQEPPPWPGFTVLPRRWVVERTFSWIDQKRRLSLGTMIVADSYERGVCLCGYDAPDGKTVGSLMRLFRRFLTAGCIDIDLPAGRCNFGRSDEPLIETAHVA